MEEEIREEQLEEEKKEQKPDGLKKATHRIGTAFMAIFTGMAVLVNGAFKSPNDLLAADPSAGQPAIVYTVDEDDADDDDDEEEGSEKTAEKQGLWTHIRDWLLRLPQPVRVLIGLPMWALGWGIVQLWIFFWNLIGQPVLTAVMAVMTLFLVLCGVFGITAKCLFPNLPLRKIFSKGNFIALGAGALVVEAALFILPQVSEDLTRYVPLMRFGAGLLLLGGLLLSLKIRNGRRLKPVAA
ncbi:MAG: hypothetical protein II882_08030 [Lachnospiraceae bacterium]|nr:hypothetical protein [Lachnospiraceae bacterium]